MNSIKIKKSLVARVSIQKIIKTLEKFSKQSYEIRVKKLVFGFCFTHSHEAFLNKRVPHLKAGKIPINQCYFQV